MTIVTDSAPAQAPIYLDATPASFQQWARQNKPSAAAGVPISEEEGDQSAAEEDGKIAVR